MVPAAVKRTLVSILVLIGSGLWVAALLIMAQTVQQSAHFSDLHPFIVGVNVAGLLVLLILRFGLGAIFPDDPEVLGVVFRYVRYVLIALWTAWLAPLTFVKLRLT